MLIRGIAKKLGIKDREIIDIKFNFQNGELLKKCEQRAVALVRGDK